MELADIRPDVVGMSADLAKYTDLHIFAKAYPDRFFQMGMAEQLLMGAAGGMAKEGFIPFATTYAVFASRRAYDFVHQVIAEENLNVKIVCALPGLTTGYGPSHQATEDIAIFRGVPNLTIVDPCDALEIEQAVPAIAAHYGPVYMLRLQSEWLVAEQLELRVVDDDAWQRVRDRFGERRGKRRTTGGHPRTLFGGLLRCGYCGGAMIAVSAHQYGCAARKDRGVAVCQGIYAPRRGTDAQLLAALRGSLAAGNSARDHRQRVESGAGRYFGG